jgi:hypothetical protein
LWLAGVLVRGIKLVAVVLVDYAPQLDILSLLVHPLL